MALPSMCTFGFRYLMDLSLSNYRRFERFLSHFKIERCFIFLKQRKYRFSIKVTFTALCDCGKLVELDQHSLITHFFFSFQRKNVKHKTFQSTFNTHFLSDMTTCPRQQICLRHSFCLSVTASLFVSDNGFICLR